MYSFSDSFMDAFPSNSVSSSHPLNVKSPPIVLFPTLYFELRYFMNVSTPVQLPATKKSSVTLATITFNTPGTLIVNSFYTPFVR